MKRESPDGFLTAHWDHEPLRPRARRPPPRSQATRTRSRRERERRRGRKGGYPENGSQRLISKRPIADRARSPRNGIAESHPERGLQSAHRRSGINSALRDRRGARCTFSCEVVSRKGWGIMESPLSLRACIGTMNRFVL